MKIALLSLGTAIVVALVAVIVRQEFFFSPERTLTEPLAEIITADLPGWKSEDLELASSQEMQERTEEILNFEEALYRKYQKGSREIGVYIAYWKPKQMPVRQVQSHTPDVCWVRNGWDLQDRADDIAFTSNGRELFPAEYRSFTWRDGGNLTHVYYWHTVGDTLYVNRTEAGEFDRLDPIKTVFKYGLDQMQEQFFVRISSNQPFGNIFESDPGMRQLMQELADLTLAAPTAEQLSQGQG